MNLNDDLKWQIFVLNATDNTVEKEHRLQTTLSCSQVCTNWREILLSSSWIWGQLMYITGQLAPDWVEEILKRSEKSPLCVTAIFTPENNTHEENFALFVRIIEDNWSRIECLQLWLYELVIPHDLYQKLWATFQRPAPLLREFDIAMPPTDVPGDALNLFNNHAPRLGIFNCTATTVPISSPWLQNLYFLHFTPASTTQLFSILSSNSALKVLNGISLESTPDMKAESSAIVLPSSLESLNLITSADMFTNFWQSIVIPKSSTALSRIKQTICFMDADFPLPQSGKRADDIMEAIKRIMHYHDKVDPPPLTRTVLIEMREDSFSIGLEPYSEIRIWHFGSSTMNYSELFMYFLILFSQIYKKATTLKIRNYSSGPLTAQALQLWTNQMRHVTDLSLESIVHDQFLSILTENCAVVPNISNDAGVYGTLIFPALHTIRIKEWSEDSLLILDTYLQKRSNVLKASVKYLYISLQSQEQPNNPWFFTLVDGLEVIWG